MLNLGFLKSMRINQKIVSFGKKNYLSTSQNKTKRTSDRIDLKEEFQDMLNETKISEEEAKNRKQEEEQRIKETMNKAKKDWEKKNETLKNEWEKKRNGSSEDEDSELKISMKKKVASAFNYSKTEGEETNNKEGKENNKNGSNNKSEKSSKNETNTSSKFSKLFGEFYKVWKQTFPGEDNGVLLLERRKQEAQKLKSMIKEPTEEEIAEIEASIPEWKRGAVVLITDQSNTETYSIFETARRNCASHLRSLKLYQDTQKSLQNSELNLLVEDLKKSYTNVRENLKESQNPFFVVSRDLIDRVSFVSPSSQAIMVMRKYDPYFDLLLFEKEVDAIFYQLMTALICDDLDTVRLVAGETALAVLTNEIKSRKERGIECKYKSMLYVDNCQYHSANVIDEGNCVLRFRVNTQEINCKISRKDGKIVEGDVNLVENIQYMIDVIRNPNPVVEEVGHSYLVVGIQRIGVMRQIV